MTDSSNTEEDTMRDDLVDRLLAQPGLYIGTSHDNRSNVTPQVARIVLRPLPGRSGVSFDFEGLSQDPARRRAHAEHSLLARTSTGLTLYTAHIHAPVTVELREEAPGEFEAVEGSSPYPLTITIDIPEPGHLTYMWTFSFPGADAPVRQVAELVRVE